MKLNHIFLAFSALIGLAFGALLIAKPDLRDAAFMPFLWVLIAMAVFEMAVYWRLGSFVGMEIRFLGFLLAVILMAGVPMLAGSPGRLF
jgi:hypothetical protein